MHLVNRAAGPKPADRVPRPGRLARCGLVLGSLLITFACAEIALRASGCRPRTATVLSTYFQPDRALGWTGRPNAACQFVTSSFDVEITHGPDGFRSGRNQALAGDAGAAAETVWCVGDSHVWGWGVADSETFVELLNRASAPRRVFRNLGISGFNTVQEYLLLREMLAKGPPPDRVLLVFCDNDLGDNLSKSQPHFALDGDQFVIQGPPTPSFLRRCGTWFKRHSLAFNYLNFYLARAKSRLNDGETSPGATRYDPTIAAVEGARRTADWTDSFDWRALHHGYRLIRELCDERGIPFSVVWQWERPVPPQLAAVTADLAVGLMDLSGSLRQQRDAAKFESPIIFPWDGHYNPTGHALVARAIEARLQAPALARRP